MSDWKFTKETDAQAVGNVTELQFKAGNQPALDADVLRSKRNVILTKQGWVRRFHNIDMHGVHRTREEVLIAANPGDGSNTGYASNGHAETIDICQMYMGGDLSDGNVANVHVVFNGPLVFLNGIAANNLTLTLANTVGGNHMVATCLSGVANTILNANNTLVFQIEIDAGTYQVNAQSISVVGDSGGLGFNGLYNPDGANSTDLSANLVITGAVSNALGTFVVSA